MCSALPLSGLLDSKERDEWMEAGPQIGEVVKVVMGSSMVFHRSQQVSINATCGSH